MDQVVVDNLSAQRIVHYLVTPYSQWEAGKLGIIDSEGKVKREPKPDEMKYFNLFHVLCKRIRDLLKTSGKGVNWVLPANAGQFYLGQNMAATQFANWNVANRSNLPIHNALMSVFKECIEHNSADLFEEKFLAVVGLAEVSVGNVADVIAEESGPMGAGHINAGVDDMSCNKTGYVESNKLRAAKLKAKLEKMGWQ